MVAGRSIIVVSRETATLNAVAAALDAPGRLPEESVCEDIAALTGRLSSAPADAVLVDLDGQPQALLGSLDPIVRRFPETRFIMLSNALDPRLMLESMQVGARHFMTKQELPANLAGVLRRVCGSSFDGAGQVISLFSAGGGCGATTLAVNLAWELKLASEHPAMIVDFDYAYGGAAAYLGAEALYGARDLQARSGPIDPDLISTTTATYAEDLRVLVSAGAAEIGRGGSFERLGDTIRACAHLCPHVVVDAPRMPFDTAAELARLSTASFVVMQLNVKDVRVAREILRTFRSRTVDPESVTLVVSRYRRRGTVLELEEARKALPETRILCVSNDFAAAAEGMNFGRPLAQAAPRSTLRRELQQLAAQLIAARNNRNGA